MKMFEKEVLNRNWEELEKELLSGEIRVK